MVGIREKEQEPVSSDWLEKWRVQRGEDRGMRGLIERLRQQREYYRNCPRVL